MTTIAFRNQIMACDTKCTDDFDAFCTRLPKIYRLQNGALLGCAGEADTREVVALLSNCSPKRLPSRASLAATRTEFNGLLAFQNGTVYFVDICQSDPPSHEWCGSLVECNERFAACGSGYQFALGAMAAGRSARQAVEIATRYDMMSGAPVIEVPLKPPAKTAKAEAK